MKVSEMCARLDAKLAALPSPQERLETIAKVLASAFGLKPDEVAVFSHDEAYTSLNFVWPPALAASGSVPLAARNSLVARTANSRRAVINNSFASTPHLFIFEASQNEASRGLPIQKILSLPLVDGDRLAGVIQLSRKGADPNAAGPDFTTADMTLLGQMAPVIVKHL
jgi:GAF domain-containing protein